MCKHKVWGEGQTFIAISPASAGVSHTYPGLHTHIVSILNVFIL